MPGMYEIRYDDGRVEEAFGIRGLYYELPEGETLDLCTEIGWCFKCKMFTDLERLQSIAEIDQNIADMHDPESMLYRFVCSNPPGKEGEFLRSQIAEARRRREFLLQRKSPPKCVHCGSDHVQHIPIEERMPHPAEAGNISIHFVGMCSTDFMNWYFTPEGDRIPKNTKPSYWYHPDLDRDRNS